MKFCSSALSMASTVSQKFPAFALTSAWWTKAAIRSFSSFLSVCLTAFTISFVKLQTRTLKAFHHWQTRLSFGYSSSKPFSFNSIYVLSDSSFKNFLPLSRDLLRTSWTSNPYSMGSRAIILSALACSSSSHFPKKYSKINFIPVIVRIKLNPFFT